MSGVLLDHKIAFAIWIKQVSGIEGLKQEPYKQWWKTVTGVNAAFIFAEDLKVMIRQKCVALALGVLFTEQF